MRRLGRTLRQRQPSQAKTIAQKVAAILRKYGTDAHVYLPGIGLINGLTAGNYLDSAGTTAATVDNPVGLVLDGAGSVKANIAVNGDFSSGAGWTLAAEVTISNGKLNFSAAANGSFCQRAGLTVGRLYKVTYTIDSVAGTVRFYNTLGSGVSRTSAGSYVEYYKALHSNFGIQCAGVTTAVLDNLIVEEVTGIHATQATTANKPILRRGAVNLLTYSEQFDNGAWGKVNATITANAIAAPDGTLTADKVVETATTGAHLFRQTFGSFVSGMTYTVSVHGKVAERSVIIIDMPGAIFPAATVWFDLASGTVSKSAGVGITAGLIVDDEGFYRAYLTRTASASGSAFVDMYMDSSPTGTVTYTGDGTSGLYVWGAMLNTGTLADYIPTTTAAASSASGNYHWVHDSTDVLTATFPAGYESATIIDTPKSGQVTLTAQNIVGAYNIGPSIDTYGRFIFKTITASELAIVQSFANRLAGV